MTHAISSFRARSVRADLAVILCVGLFAAGVFMAEGVRSANASVTTVSSTSVRHVVAVGAFDAPVTFRAAGH